MHEFNLNLLIAVTSLVWEVHSATSNTYSMSVLANAGVSDAFEVKSEADCSANCSATVGCSAVSYSSYRGMCKISKCSNLIIIPNALWVTTLLISLPVLTSCLPRPMFEWIMTDACGFANTGYKASGWPMTPMYNLSEYPLSYMPSVSAYFGKAVSYPDANGYYTITTPSSNANLDYTKPLTVFAYIWMASIPPYISIFEVGSFTSNPYWYGWGYHAQLYPSGILNLVILSDLCRANCSPTCKVVPPVRTWNHVAFVLDPINKQMAIYLNGTQCSLSYYSPSTAASPSSYNVFTAVGRPASYAHLNGTIMCLKVFNQALSGNQVLDVAKTCAYGNIVT